MAKGNDFGVPEEGTVGPYSIYTRDGETIFRKRHNVKSKKKPTEGQREIQMGFANEVVLYGLFGDKLDLAFEKEMLRPGQTAFNAFMSLNERFFHIYLTKMMVKAGSCVIPPVWISQGSLRDPISYQKVGDNVVTDIKLGDLVIDRDTTVEQFARAVINNNQERFSEAHFIGFFKGHQTLNINTHFPMGQVASGRVKLDSIDDQGQRVGGLSLWSVTGSDGFHSVDGYLGTPYAPNDLYAWVKIEKTAAKEYRSTTQMMQGGDTSLLEHYSSKEAFEAACESYGGFSTKYLAPFENQVNYREFALPGTGAGSTGGSGSTGSGGSQGGSGSTGGSGSQGSGSQGGSGSTGSGGSGTGERVQVTVKTNPTECISLVSGGGEYEVGTRVTLRAESNSEYTFLRWNTGTTTATMEITVPEGGATYTAYFDEV